MQQATKINLYSRLCILRNIIIKSLSLSLSLYDCRFFDTFHLIEVRHDLTLLLITLIAWSLSVIQFSIVTTEAETSSDSLEDGIVIDYCMKTFLLFRDNKSSAHIKYRVVFTEYYSWSISRQIFSASEIDRLCVDEGNHHKKKRKKRGGRYGKRTSPPAALTPPQIRRCYCCTLDVLRICMSMFLQDGPYLGIRLFLIIKCALSTSDAHLSRDHWTAADRSCILYAQILHSRLHEHLLYHEECARHSPDDLPACGAAAQVETLSEQTLTRGPRAGPARQPLAHVSHLVFTSYEVRFAFSSLYMYIHNQYLWLCAVRLVMCGCTVLCIVHSTRKYTSSMLQRGSERRRADPVPRAEQPVPRLARAEYRAALALDAVALAVAVARAVAQLAHWRATAATDSRWWALLLDSSRTSKH